MDADDFFNRWSRRKAEQGAFGPVEAKAAPASGSGASGSANPAGPVDSANAADAVELPPPSLEDVSQLTRESDFSRFMARGVDETVKRSAMKKLFSDPRYNIMDGLDTYIEDYNKFVPIPPEALARMDHAKALLDPLAQLAKPLMRVVDKNLPPPLPGEPPAEQAGNQVPFAESEADSTVPVERPDAANDGAPEATNDTVSDGAPDAASDAGDSPHQPEPSDEHPI